MIFENIRNLREDNDKKQQELADYLNIKQTTYSKYELGKINIPIEVFIKLADYYGVSIDYIVGRTPSRCCYKEISKSLPRKKN
ncbi:MAG: helix-turn-helix transcriptional regulator [Lachnospiraceae bacterium]|nr:helix-turn-helix transcriptional regulator [Lachnospiraceae bacterium]